MNPIIALLPMKGHSERVPNKNMRAFCGFPLYHAIVQTLLKVPQIPFIVIDTDSETIKHDALTHFGEKIKIINRPASLCGDFVSMNEIIAHDIQQFNEYAYFIQTHSTNPLLSSNSVEKACTFFTQQKNNYDSVFSVTRLQTRLYRQSGEAINHNPKELLRTQDLPPVFEENSNFYIFSHQSFFENNKQRIGKKPYMYEINKLEAVDIDEEEDFIIAETLYKTLKKA